METWKSLPSVIRHLFLAIGIFGLGAALAFGYSYRPLHGALTFRVDSLETRLDERNRENTELKDEIARIKSDEETRIDPETLSQVERELAQTKQVLADAEKKTAKLDRKRRDANASADRWRKRFESLRDQQQAMPAATASPPPAPPSDVEPSPNMGNPLDSNPTLAAPQPTLQPTLQPTPLPTSQPTLQPASQSDDSRRP